MKIAAIAAGHVDAMWHLVGAGIERMIDKGIGTTTVEEIKGKAESGEWMLFTVEHDGQILATFVCSISTGTRRVFEVGMAWGHDMELWLDPIYDTLLEVAKQLGCDSVAITGRRGWAHYFASRGFKEKMITLVKDI